MPEGKNISARPLWERQTAHLKGLGSRKAKILSEDLGVSTWHDLLNYFPFRYEDRSRFYDIAQITEDDAAVQIKGRLIDIREQGSGHKKRLEATIEDATGIVKLVWFKGINFVKKKLNRGTEYLVFGKPKIFGYNFSIPHPDFEPYNPAAQQSGSLHPVYHTSERMKRNYLDSKGLSRVIKPMLRQVYNQIYEIFPKSIRGEFKLSERREAYRAIHFPRDLRELKRARFRLKFEELFFIQLKLIKQKKIRQNKLLGQQFKKMQLLNDFYNEHLPFELTGAQKRVIKEIYRDVTTGMQMNRLLQGDVGSGKTIVAFICMLMALDNGAQACMMAPTEILAQQHFKGLSEFAEKMDIRMALLTGSTKTKARREIDEGLRSGEIKIIVGTHALLEDKVQFENLGLCVIDEQHRFGVAQRAKLWAKSRDNFFPHVLVMTATPIPRTLAMTLYGDLDISVIDELPAGRKPIKTSHHYEKNRLKVFGFVREQIREGRQVYIVYPLIEESEKLDYNNLMEGYESIKRAFPDIPISVVHGQMKPADKEYEMLQFAEGKTRIMVATTVIEVGVNVPNATLMIIENSERFGLAQLHQLRGRVGRGAEQSYCVLMTGYKLSKEGRTRLETMVETTDGFKIADVDLKLRGPGALDGTQQSGITDLNLADLAKDGQILEFARSAAEKVLKADPKLEAEEHRGIRWYMARKKKQQAVNWSRIS